jgi:hypothetical protein
MVPSCMKAVPSTVLSDVSRVHLILITNIRKSDTVQFDQLSDCQLLNNDSLLEVNCDIYRLKNIYFRHACVLPITMAAPPKA